MLAPTTVGLALAAAVLASSLVACQGEPSRLCDRARVIWPFFDIDPADDVDPDQEGIQVDLTLRTSLPVGSTGILSVEPVEGDPAIHPQSATAGEDGVLDFHAVTLPTGRVTLTVFIENECGQASTTRSLFVWDGLGIPSCELAISPAPVEVEGLAPLGVLRAEHDADPEAPGLPLEVEVLAGRPDMTVTLFALDLGEGLETRLESEAGADGAATFSLTLADGEHALRAVCHWAAEDLRPSSITRRLWIDTEPPDCELLRPAGRVGPGDDLDPDQPGIQVEVRGRSTAPDAVGEPASFVVNGAVVAGGRLDELGEAAAIATIEAGPGPQVFTFHARDRAGNPCEDTVTFD
jgi:hypothetical protein